MIVSTTLAGPGAEHVIRDALLTAAPLVESCLVLFSGCDRAATLDVCRQVSRESGTPFNFGDFTWPGHYGHARSYALLRARDYGAEWALTLDVDERLELPDNYRGALRHEFDVVALESLDSHYLKPRFIRCREGIEWKGRVHEKLVGYRLPVARAEGGFRELPKEDAARRRVWERCVAWWREKPEEVESDPNWRRHLAECLMGFEDWKEARRHLEAVAAMPSCDHDERAWVTYRLAELDVLDGNLDGAWLRASLGLTDNPSYIQEFGWVLAHVAARQGFGKRAALWAEYALAAPMDPFRTGQRSPTWQAGCEKLLEAIGAGQPRPPAQEFEARHFEARDEFRPEYAELARALVETLSFGSHLDLGAGQGLLVQAMHGAQVISSGIEQSIQAQAHCGEAAAGCIEFGTGLEGWATGAQHDLVSCVEVLEHVPPELADLAVAAICLRSSRYVYLSAAQPGQGGVGHVNEQPPHYWIQKFRAHDFELDEKATERLRERIACFQRCWWLPRNALIFKRLGAES